jgi:S1-C subfamily serine protease
LPFFGRYKMTIDYQQKELTFIPNGHEPPDAMEAMMATVMALMTRDKPPTKVLAAAGQWGLVVAKEEDDEEAGVTVKKVMPASAAAKAGLKPGDRLLTLDDRWTDSVSDCYAAAAAVKPDKAVRVTIRRSGKEQELKITPNSGL